MSAASTLPLSARFGTRVAGLDDRRLFPLVAGLYLIIALLGFVPSSVQKLAEVAAGQRPPFLPVLHVHAAAMAGWLLLLLAQAGAAAAGRRRLHRVLAVGGLALAVTIIASGLVLVPGTFRWVWAMTASPPPQMPAAAVDHVRLLITNLPLLQYRALAVFAILFAWALLLRRSDPGTHRRLMILATATPLLAAVDRLAWLPTTMPASPLSLELCNLLLVLPLLANDLVRERRVPRAYAIWFAVSLPFVVVTHSLWGTPGWTAIAPRLMGAG